MIRLILSLFRRRRHDPCGQTIRRPPPTAVVPYYDGGKEPRR